MEAAKSLRSMASVTMCSAGWPATRLAIRFKSAAHAGVAERIERAGFGARLRVGDVLQGIALVQVGVHEFERRAQDAFAHQGAVEGGLAGTVGAGEQVEPDRGQG